MIGSNATHTLNETKESIYNQIRQDSLAYYVEEVKKQNKNYFSMKIRDLLERQKMGNDIVATIKAKFILKNLSVNPQEYIENYEQLSEKFKIAEQQECSDKKEKKAVKKKEAIESTTRIEDKQSEQ